MAGYQLEATDGTATYPIPQGETTIGRGAFLGIADKRVSRNHAVLEVVEDKLRLKPVHVNPCFYRASHKNKFVPLEKNEWCWLHSGDCFSLLPDKYSFRVIAEHASQEATQRNSQALDGECAFIDSPCSATGSEPKDEVEEPSCSGTNNSNATSLPPSAKGNKRKEEAFPNSHSAASCKTDEQSKPAARKRNLPSWMLQGDLPIQSLPSPVIKTGKKRRNVAVARPRKTAENVTEKKHTPPVKSKDVGEEGSVKKNKATVPSAVSPGSSCDIGSAKLEPHENAVNDEVEEMEIDELTPELSPQMEIEDNRPSGSGSIQHSKISGSKPSKNDDQGSPTAGSPQIAQQTSSRRTPCMYAERCYRKNPVHFEEFSHPGDSDYNVAESGSQDDNDDRPECPYGTDCYRKNPQHKLEYKHTKPPGRQLRKRTKKKAKGTLDDDSDNDGEPNEYDLEDSFIDDEEEEEEEEDFTDEDSEWMPDSQDKDSEDMKQLLKEAKQFVKRKH